MSQGFTAEEVRVLAHELQHAWSTAKNAKAIGMLNAYADRIEADESAVPWKSIDGAPRDGTVILLRWGEDAITPAWWNGDVPTSPDAPDDLCWSFIDAESAEFNRYFVNRGRDNKYGPSHWAPYSEKYFSHPPAQVVDVDCKCGVTCKDNGDACRYASAADPVAQGDAIAWMTPGGDVSRSYLWCTERCRDGHSPTPLYLATQPHSPDAADSGRVTEEMVEAREYFHAENQRVIFETWMKRSHAFLPMVDGVYIDHGVMSCWNSWLVSSQRAWKWVDAQFPNSSVLLSSEGDWTVIDCPHCRRCIKYSKKAASSREAYRDLCAEVDALLREALRYLDPRHYRDMIKRIDAHLKGADDETQD